jgi:hypothetical protein
VQGCGCGSPPPRFQAFFPSPYFLFRRASPAASLSPLTGRAGCSFSLVVILLLSVRPFLFRLRIGCGSVLPPSRSSGNVRRFFWAVARGILMSPWVRVRGCLARRFGGMADRAALPGGGRSVPFMGPGAGIGGCGQSGGDFRISESIESCVLVVWE